MRIVCIGGGPAGLYFGLLMKKENPAHQVTVVERNRPYDTFGWGVVFSDQTMANFRAADARSHAAIVGSFHHWDDIDIHFAGRRFVSGGHGFCGISRKRLLGILQERAAELGVRQDFEREVDSEGGLEDADLIVAADGANSKTRQRHEAMIVDLDLPARCPVHDIVHLGFVGLAVDLDMRDIEWHTSAS